MTWQINQYYKRWPFEPTQSDSILLPAVPPQNGDNYHLGANIKVKLITITVKHIQWLFWDILSYLKQTSLGIEVLKFSSLSSSGIPTEFELEKRQLVITWEELLSTWCIRIVGAVVFHTKTLGQPQRQVLEIKSYSDLSQWLGGNFK